ncbi:MAG: hypothetical protein JXA30_12025 [Deltaproteobacteria bacterium]|nr:hypothetical protein [Deltaproteobacteria bacterium]
MVFSRRIQLPAVVAAFSLLVFTGSIRAQTDPEAGDVGAAEAEGSASTSVSAGGEWGGSVQGQTSSSESTWQADSSSTATESDSSSSSTGSDHEKMAGNFGVGFFGVFEVPVGISPVSDDDTVSAPTIGVRYWLSSFFGIEAALGLGITSASSEFGDESTDLPSYVGFALHGGVPLALASSGHFVFEVIPELNFGISTGSEEGDVDYSGILFELGGRIGGEVHFGFIDIPQLSLQGTLGLHVRHESRSTSTAGGDASESRTFFGTSVGNEPWDIFTGNIAAIYYFP